MRISGAASLIAAALAGCGGSSDGLAPAAAPAPSPPLAERPAGRLVERPPAWLRSQPGARRRARVGAALAVLDVRERALRLVDPATRRTLDAVNVGIGPTQVVARGARLFVVDTRGDALLEVHTEPLRVHRRTHVAGSPYGIAFDAERRRFWVALTALNRVAELTDRRVLRTFATLRQPGAVAVDPVSGRVSVASRTQPAVQLFDPPPYRK